MDFLFFSTVKDGYILAVNCTYSAETGVNSIIKQNSVKYLLKSKTVTPKGLELTYEIRLKDKEAYAVNKLMSLQGVENATLVSYNGEYMS